MAVSVYNPSSTKIVHWTGVDFASRPTSFPPIHLVQYDQGLPIIAVNLYKEGQVYTIPSNANANILVEKRDGTFVSNPALGCNQDRNVLYFEATYQMLYFDKIIKPVIEIKLSDTEYAGSSPIIIVVDRNPVQEGAKKSSNEYKSVEQFMNDALAARDQARSSASIATQAQQAASQSEKNAKTSEQNARDYAFAGVDLMESLKASNSILERVTDSDGNPVLDSSGNEIMGAVVQYATMVDFSTLQESLSILQNRKDVLESRLKHVEELINKLEEHAILDSTY